MKIAVLIPDRGDRPEFLENCLRMMHAQTLKPAHILVISDPPKNEHPDITYRYRIGYDQLSIGKFDLIALIENDDFYSPIYLETMVRHWEFQKRPQMIGTTYSTYYHIGLLKWIHIDHYSRSAAMNTMLVPGLQIPWCPDHEPFTDLHLWMNCPDIRKILVTPEIISLGIKHGTGLCGAGSHVSKLEKYRFIDPEMTWLKNATDRESFQFYQHIHSQLKNKFSAR